MNFTTKKSKLNQAQRDKLVSEWQHADTLLKSAKAAEYQLRLEIARDLFDARVESGTENLDLGSGYILKCTKKLNYSLDAKKVEGVLQSLSSPILADRLVTWKPDLRISEYKQLPDDDRVKVDTVLTIKQATPAVQLVEPKQ